MNDYEEETSVQSEDCEGEQHPFPCPGIGK